MMKYSNLAKTALIVGALVSMVGCANMGKSKTMHSRAVGDVTKFYGEEMTADREKALLAKQTLYFEFDRYELSEENKLVALAHAKKLLENPRMKIRIEGHCDERGSREYNIALGEKRAQVASQLMAMKGVPADQVAIVSYGKEKPQSLGHDEASWELNRRDEIVYE
jgi:peptidoglycan-associated lipoprotein